MACSYKMKDAAGAWQTITGKPAMMAALADGRLDHLLSAEVVRAMTATAAAAPKETPAQRPAPAPAPNTIFTEDAATKARELLRRKLGQLNSGLDPEMLQAGITLAGYHIEKGARSFSAYAQAMLADLGDAVRPYLKSWYMGVKYDPRAAGFEGMDTAATVEAADENEISKEPENAPSTDGSVERNSQEPASERAVGDAVQDGARGSGAGAREDGGRARREGRSGQSDGSRVPADRAAAGGERSNQQLPAGDAAAVLADVSAGAEFRERGSDIGFDGVSADPIPASQVAAAAGAGAAILPKIAQQRAAEKLTVVPRDLDNIRATLPYLLPEQQEDVLKAEERFAKPDGYGMLFTNGTGTGKTFTGLGVVKRAVRQGKTNILIAVPNDKIAADWIESGEPLGLTITKLKDTKDAGQGVVVTTYANLGANDALASRGWDMVVADEAHYLMQDKDGTPTTYLENLRAITLHPDGAPQRYTMLNRGDIDRMKALSEQIDFNSRIANGDDTMEQHRASLAKENAELEKEHKALADKLQQARADVRAYVSERQGEARPRLVALSATPFAYMPTVDWANGYLFDYNEGQPDDGASGTGGRPYNSGSNRERFFMQRFGYTMRYNKLNKPDETKVDVGLMQRQFNAWLKKTGSLSGRQLEVEADYDRRFVLVDSAIGNQIDDALNWLSESARNAPKGDRGFYALRDRINDKFDYLNRRYLLEAIKATEAVPIVKAHMALGRKVVVFHDYLQGGGFNPFNVPRMTTAPDANEEDKAQAEQFNAALRQFNAKFATLVNAPLGQMSFPIEVFKREIPGVLLVNGNEKKGDILKRYKLFQDDASGPQVMLVQSAKNAGWSGHDTTGKHQRVLINIGQPTAPTMAIQQEGRIYRTGQVSNAIVRYLNTGTNWEKWAFAKTIATRASHAENLGAGEQSRALKDSFIAAFEESDAYPPGHEGEGTGGKERDKAQNNALTAFDRAKTFYWATQKKNSRTKAQEGVDYFATPEPVGLKMVEWLGLRGGESALEPSAGHGAIARWIPDTAKRTVIEPSPALRSRLAMVMDPGNDRIIDGTFEELASANKFDGIAMNPPFGVGGKTAVEHLAKAAGHLRDGGRIVALIPTGPAADKRFEKWMYGEETRDLKPLLTHPTLGPIYRGDTITSRAAWAPEGVVSRTNKDGGVWVKLPGRGGETSVSETSITGVSAKGPRSETYRPAADMHMVAEVRLPQVTFERAGTAVATRIVVLEKHRDASKAPNPRSPIDLTDISDIRQMFDRIESLDLPARRVAAEQESAQSPAPQSAAQTEAAPVQPATSQNADQGPTIERNGRPIVQHVTQKWKTIRGVVATDITKAQAQEIDPYTFKKGGGWFIREKHLKNDGAAPAFSRAGGAMPATINVDGVERPTTNSTGKPIHPTEEGVRSFWRWFGDSRVVDEQGRPLVVYHGTSSAFEKFDRNRTGSSFGVDNEIGFYFTSNPDTAGLYAERVADKVGANVMPVYVRLSNPLVMEDNFIRGPISFIDWNRDSLRNRADAKGNDGVIVSHHEDGVTEEVIVVAFSPEQIKSATGNAGTFGGASANILRSASTAQQHQGITADDLPAIFARRFPKLAGAVKSMVDRGLLGMSGGLVVLDTNDEIEMAREFASRAGHDMDATMQTFESEDGRTINGFYDPSSGLTFLVGPNLSEKTAPAVVMHEVVHGQRREQINRRALALIEGRANEKNPELRAFLDRVADRMEQVGETGNANEAASYIVEFATQEGRQAGFSTAEGPMLAWVERNLGKKVADILREFIGAVRAWALANGVPLKSMSVDDLMAYAQMGVKKAAKGRVKMFQGPVPASAQADDGRPQRAGWSEARVDGLIREFGYDFDPKRTKAFAAFVNPADFLNATTPKKDRDTLEAEAKPLDRDGLAKEKQAIYLQVRPTDEEGAYQIVGHEGRHRMMALRDAGYSRVPVVLIMPDAVYDAEAVDEPYFAAQKFGDGTRGAKGFDAREAIPITSGNRAELVELFSQPASGAGDVQFSRSAPLRAATKAATSALNKFSPSGQAALGTLTADQQAAVERVFGKPKTLAERAEAFAKDWKKNLVQGVFDQFAPIKEISSKGYMLARLAKGGDSTLEALMMYGKVSVDGGGVYKVDFDGQNLKGFASAMAKLDGEHDRFLAWVSGQRAERLAGVGLENLMTPQDIAALKTLADGSTASGKVRRALYAEALRELNAFNDSVLKIAADSGLIDEATRAMYRDTPYVPFYRLSEEEVVKGPAVSKGLVNQSAWKQLKGGTDKLNEDLMGNLLKNWSHLITASANNRAAKEVLDTAARMGAATDMTNDVVAQDINGQPIYRGNTKGLVRYRGEIKRKIPAGQPYIENGQTLISDGTAEIAYVGDRYFRVDDPHLMDAIASIGFTTKVWKPMADFKRYLTFGVTVNPTFKIRNLIRDSIQAVGTADLSYNPVKNILMGAKGTEMMSNMRAQMMASGGMLRFGSSEGAYSGHVRRLIEKGVDPQYILDNDSKVKAFWKHKVLPAFEAYQELGDRSENVNRAALYEQLLAKGMSHAEASFWARDMMDFSMHGKWAAIRTLTAVVPFMNARLQGIYKLGRATKADYRRMSATLAAVSLASMALMLAYGDDDDWKKREDWDRDNSWWFKIGDTAFRIPKPFEVGAVGTIAERSLELMISDEMTGKRFGQRMRDLLMQNLSMNPTPQLVKPMIDLYANKDGFSGRDIETQGMEKMRPEDRYTARTSEVARFLGQLGLPNPAQLLMGRVEGLSPVQIDHLIRGYFSWVGTSATNVLDRGIRPMMDRGEQPDMRLRDVFLAGNFVETLPTGSSRYVTQFYEQAREIEQMYASYRQALKEGDAEKAQEIRDENPEGFAARRRIEAAKRAESLISGQMRTIERDRAMTGEEKRARLDQLEKRRDEIARRALLVPAAAGRD